MWLLDLYHQRKMIWLYGPAGVGKSAIAQTFGELARNRGYLGAAFFSVFNKPSTETDDSLTDLNDFPADPFRIIPTLAYQLAVHNTDYQQLVTQRLAGDPLILKASLSVQFQKLVIEPFASLTLRDPQEAAKAQLYLIILDGLDECENEKAECELIELINNAAQRNDLPLLWLLCSRPEPHIKYTFSQSEFIQSCDREELVIDDEARADVEKFLQESFKEIHTRYRSVIIVEGGDTWPSKQVFDKISKAVSGYFVFASAVTRVVGDRIVRDPESQLSALLSMLQGLDIIGIKDPFKALDIFYSRILSRIPQDLRPTAIQILGVCARMGVSSHKHINSVERLRLFLRIEKAAFYHSLEKLHSVVRVPEPEDAQDERISFHHKSFADYLKRQRRSGKFFISSAGVDVLFGLGGLHLYNHVLVYENPDLVKPDEHKQSRPALMKWCYGGEVDDRTLIGLGVAVFPWYLKSAGAAKESDAEFFNTLYEFNFSLLARTDDDSFACAFVESVHFWDWSKTTAGLGFVRTEVIDQSVDPKLLRYLSILTKGKLIPPADIHEPVVYEHGRPVPWKGPPSNTMAYIIVGNGERSGLVCCYKGENNLQAIVLSPRIPPTKTQTAWYHNWEGNMGRSNQPEAKKEQDMLRETPDLGCQNQ